jgi:hypothetical protein
VKINNFLDYLKKQAAYFGRIYEIDSDDLFSESWIRLSKEKSINKKYIQLRVQSVAIDMLRKNIRYNTLIEKIKMNYKE